MNLNEITNNGNVEYTRSLSQNLRFVDDGLTHAIEQLRLFNSETMSDLSLKYELMRNNESRVISFFARLILLSRECKVNQQNGSLYNEYLKLDRFLSVLNFQKPSIEYIGQRITFDNLFDIDTSIREKTLYDAGTTETERIDFRNALKALIDCMHHFSNDDTNDNGRFCWHKEIPVTESFRQQRSSDTALTSPPIPSDTTRSTSVSSSTSPEFGFLPNNSHATSGLSSNTRRNNPSHTPPTSRLNQLSTNGKGKYEHPTKLSSTGQTNFNTYMNSSRNIDLQLPNDDHPSRRSSNGSDSESRLPSGSATPKSPTIRSPTMSGSPFGSAHNSDAENDAKPTDGPVFNNTPPVLAHRLAHKIQHKWSNLIKLSTCNVCMKKIILLGVKCNNCKFDKTRVFKFSFCDVCKKQVFRGKPCMHCKYKCHKECVPHAPADCGFSEVKVRRAIDDANIQSALANSSPTPRKYPFPLVDSTSPTGSTPLSTTPNSPAANASISISESIYSTNNDPDCWVVIEATNKTVAEMPESQSDSDTNTNLPADIKSNTMNSKTAKHGKLVRQPSQNEPSNPRVDELVKSKIFDINSFDDDEADPEKRSMNLATSLQDWVIVFNNIKIVEEIRRSSGRIMKGLWHGDVAVRMIKIPAKCNEIEFLNEFRNQVFRLRKVRHEHLNLYTGVCIESPNLAIVSNWIRVSNLFDMIHIRNDPISLDVAVQYAAQIAQAMSYLHEKKILHMSLRTTNIFVQNGRIILTDYGLVPLTKCYQITNQPAIIAPRGWLSYLAPEIIRKINPFDEKSFLKYTPQTDVYAFGTVWYELLFREFPYAKQPPEYIIWRAGNSLKQPLSSVHINKHAKDIINQCWSFAPDERPDFAMLCKSLSKMPNKRALVRSPSTPLQYNTRSNNEAQF